MSIVFSPNLEIDAAETSDVIEYSKPFADHLSAQFIIEDWSRIRSGSAIAARKSLCAN